MGRGGSGPRSRRGGVGRPRAGVWGRPARPAPPPRRVGRRPGGGLCHKVRGGLIVPADQGLACPAGIAPGPDGSLTLAGRPILGCAPRESRARACLETIVTAMHGSEPAAADLSGVTWRLAPKDRKSTRLNSSHSQISYAVFCLKKKKRLLPYSWLLHDRIRTSTYVYTVSTYLV